MTERLAEKFRSWDAIENDPDLEKDALSLVQYLAKRTYGDYEPDGLRPFILRLEKWLDNLTAESDQKILLSLLSRLFFAGRGEFESLYRSTLTNVYRWLIELTSTDIAHPKLDTILDSELRQTWICPITDSLRINSFLKINEISGHDHRPHWRSLAKFGDVAKIQQYINSNLIQRLVLIEDFVGSGGQIESTVDFVCKNFPNLQIALCPLIICPTGDQLLAQIAAQQAHFTYLPTLVLPEEVFLTSAPRQEEPITFTKGRALIERLRGRFSTEAFGHRQTGALVALFSNCPDNTLAIFRDPSKLWYPLFPRVRRPE